MGHESEGESSNASTPDADYTPNPRRALWVTESLREPLLTRLQPRIVDLVSSSRSPITVYIDSPGGYVDIAHTILTLLKWPDPSDKSRCRVITVALRRVSSAATHLLAGGDVAIAQRDCRLLYHGVGHPLHNLHEIHGVSRLTAEVAERFATSTKFNNERSAAALARMCVPRGLAMISALRSGFEVHRVEVGNPNLTDLECFQAVLISKLSPPAKRVIRRARAMQTRSEALANCFLKEIADGRPQRKADVEWLMLRAATASECRHKNRLLSAGGLSRINEHFFFLREFVAEDGAEIGDFCDAPELSHTTADPAPAPREAMRDYFLPFWPFLIAVHRALGKGENELTAMDAFWLGLVDTVRDVVSSP